MILHVIIIGLIISNVATFVLFWVERHERQSYERRVVYAQQVASFSAQQNVPVVIHKRMRPFVENDTEEGTEHQKKMRILLAFLKEYPFTSTDLALESIHRHMSNAG